MIVSEIGDTVISTANQINDLLETAVAEAENMQIKMQTLKKDDTQILVNHLSSNKFKEKRKNIKELCNRLDSFF